MIERIGSVTKFQLGDKEFQPGDKVDIIPGIGLMHAIGGPYTFLGLTESGRPILETAWGEQFIHRRKLKNSDAD